MSEAAPIPKFWLETPLIRSSHISNLLGCSAYLKLESVQPSQSFKYRGLSLFVQQCIEKHGQNVHLIIASGGNAGLAVACAGNVLNVRCTVYIPEGVSQRTLDFLKNEHAEVIITGKCYLQALQRAEEALECDKNAVMVPAYDHPIVWQGHASMIHEIAKQLPSKPDAIFCSVGGGGLLGGVMVGCKDVGWNNVPIVALETHGSSCFYHSVSVNAGQFNSAKVLPEDIKTWYDEEIGVSIAHINTLTSRATSLGASSPAPTVVKMALEREGGIKCVCIPDEMAMQTADLFAEDHKMLVELACSTTLTPAYSPSLFAHLVPSTSDTRHEKTVVFIVCGGFKISLDEMEEYRKIVSASLKNGDNNWKVVCDGKRLPVAK